MKRFTAFALLLIIFLVPVLTSGQKKPAGKQEAKTPRAIKFSDAKDWQRVGQFRLSPDAKWKAFVVRPGEGDATLTIAKLKSDESKKQPAKNESKQAAKKAKDKYEFVVGPASGQIIFSKDSRFVAFVEAPKDKVAKAARKAKKPLKSKAVLIELATGEKHEFENAQRISFSGENSKCFAIHRSRPSGRPSGDAGWAGSDLIVMNLASKKMVNIGNVKSFQFNKSGAHLAMLIDAEAKMTNGLQLMLSENFQIIPMESDKAEYKSLTWNKEGDSLAMFKAIKDKSYENPKHELIAYSDVGTPNMKRVHLDATKIGEIPDDMTISTNRSPQWTTDRTAILFGIHKLKKKEGAKGKTGDAKKEGGKSAAKPKAAPKTDDGEQANVVVWHWKDKRLQSMQQRQASRDKSRYDLCIHHVKDNKTFRLGDEEIPNVFTNKPFKFAIGSDNRKYELMGNLDGRRYRDIYSIDLKSNKRKLILEKSRFSFGVGPSGIHYLYYEDGHFLICNLTTGKKTNITKSVEASFVDTEDDHNVVKPPRRPFGWSSNGDYVLLSDGFDVWKVAIDGSGGTNLTVNGKEKQIRYSRPLIFDPDQTGADFSKPVYIRVYGEWTKKAGFGRIMPGKAGVEMLVWDDASFGNLSKVKDQDVYYYSRATQQTSSNMYVAGPDLKDAKQHTDINKHQKNFKWSAGVKLVNYTSDNGDKLQGALYLPAGYIEGKKYPTILYMYEKLSQRANSYDTPRHGGFSASIYTSNGYAVFNPDIVFRVNDPGLSSKDCILAGLKAAVETGVVDPENVGIHGHSWGGYQTAFLITQTDKFKAAVSGAPLTNLISMYSSIYFNSGSANQPIFESSQGRFTGGYWTNIEAYTRNSPVYHAEKVKTPLLLLHNDQDGAVDWNQGIEYFNTLRRLKKPVVMLQYVGENHGLRKTANRKDYSYRMMEFFDHHLKGKDAPAWWKEGIKHLDMKKHIKDYKKAKQSADK